MVLAIVLAERYNMLILLLSTLTFVSTISLLIVLSKYILLKKHIAYIIETLEEIHAGNLNRKLLATRDNETKELCFLINGLCSKYQSDINDYKSTEKKYKDLMINLSHDVRTPLAAMLGYLELMPSSDLPVKTVTSIQAIEKKAYQLKEFIDLLFQWTKLDANEEYLSFSTYDLAELSRNILSNWIILLEDKDINYKINIPDFPISCYIDSAAYERIVNNIIKNVIYHSHANCITFTIIPSENNVIIQLEDNGVGIKETEQHLVFDRLYRTDHSRTSKGNGLGLAIVKELVNKLNGTITLSSIPTEYTRFIITLPLTTKL